MTGKFAAVDLKSSGTFEQAVRNSHAALVTALRSSSTVPVVRHHFWKRSVAFLLAGGVGLGAVGAAVRPWLNAPVPLDAHSTAITLPAVTVTQPTRQATADVTLPATVQPWQSTRLFSRVSGYVKSWKVEMGQTVTAGDLLAEIDTPELDQELLQAQADFQAAKVAVAQAEAELAEQEATLQQAEADQDRSQAELSLAGKQLQRRDQLVSRNQAYTREDLDVAVRDRDARQAEVTSSKAAVVRHTANLETRKAIIDSRKAAAASREANVRRLQQLQSFKRIEAPFSGVITRRRAEVGSLVAAGSNAGESLFEMAQTDRVRVQVAVPQSDAQGLRPGVGATILVPELPGHDQSVKVTRTSETVDPSTRTLLVEMELPNSDGQMTPGIYAQARFEKSSDSKQWTIPTSALRMQVDGPHVVTADSKGTLKVLPVELGRNFGTHVAILQGLNGDERLVVNPGDDLQSGMQVVVSR